MKATALLLTGMLTGILTTGATPLFATEAPFSRGVNLTNWFQAGSAAEIDFHRYDRDDFEQIRNLGADVIRLPINLHHMTDGAPDYVLDPLFLGYLDQAVDWAEALGLHLVLDNHTFDPSTNTDPAVREVLLAVWPQMARHFRNRGDTLYYEVLNEPHGIDDATWNGIQQDVVAAIREVDDRHTIIIGPAGWNSYHNLEAMPVYDDDNLIVTFHFYDPFLFTHQGATWVEPSMASLAGMPFPYRAEDMPPLPAELEGTWVGDAYDRYAQEGTLAEVRRLLEIAEAFRASRGVPLFLGELGVYMNNSDNADRVAWYAAVREILDEMDIAWTAWDYHGGFGLFEPGSDGRYEHDLNVPLLEALGFVVPPQTAAEAQPDTVGMGVYDDRAAEGVRLAGQTGGRLDFVSRDRPAQGGYAIEWSGPSQYEVAGFDFSPDRDLAFLAGAGYALALQLRCDRPGTHIGLRFLDSDTGPDDHPWRSGVALAADELPCDDAWHELHLPLAALPEQGAWEDGDWFEPVGDFDWSAIDRLEVVAENAPPAQAKVWIDHVRITRLPADATWLDHEAGMNGLFFDPAAPGHGFDFNVVEEGLVVYYYGHTADGERLWLVSEALPGNLNFGEALDLTFYEVPTGVFGAPGGDGAVPWGNIVLTLHSCGAAHAEFDGIDGQASMDLVRLAGVPRVFCNRD